MYDYFSSGWRPDPSVWHVETVVEPDPPAELPEDGEAPEPMPDDVKNDEVTDGI